MTEFRQLDIYWVDLEPTKGAETRKLRPCVIVQSDLVNVQSRTLIVAPLLPQHKPWPLAVNLEPSAANGLDKDRHINLKQLRAIDISRIRCLVPRCTGVIYNQLPKEELWDRYYMEAPARQRQCVERYNIVKRA